jgi:ABC-type nitrate/sulfonate/bicarbonate transport system substrate-binding protein
MAERILWYTRCPTPTAFGISIQNGWIEEEFSSDGILVRSLTSSSDPKIRQSHFEATQPNFFRHGGNGPPIVSRSRGADIRVVGVSWNRGYKPILSLPGSGIRAVSDLKGRRFSIPRRAKDSVDFWRATVLRGLGHALVAGGLDIGDVQHVEVTTDRTFVEDTRPASDQSASLWDARFMLGHQREEAFALIHGEVDAIYSQGAMAAIVEGFLGAVTVFDNGDESAGVRRANNDAPYVLTVSGSLIDERPDLVERWLVRVLAAADWARDHARAAKRIIAAEAGVAEELVDRAYSTDIHRELDIDLAEDRIEALRSQHDHLLRHGFLDRRVDFSAFIDPRPLAGAQERLARRRATLSAA